MYSLKNGIAKDKSYLKIGLGLFAGLLVAASLSVSGHSSIQARGGNGAAVPGDNKEVVIGTTAPCAKATIDAGATTSLYQTTNEGIDVYWSNPLALRGTLTNCSTSLQAYYVEFTETTDTPIYDIINQEVCRAQYWGVGDFILKSGKSVSWNLQEDFLAGAGIVDPKPCLGTHTVQAKVIDRYTGRFMFATQGTYTVTLK